MEDRTICPRHAPHAVARTVDDVVVLLDLTTEVYYSLNDVGARVWDLADGQHAVAAIVDVLASEYDAARDQISDDVQALIEELAAEGLITWDGR